MGKRNNPGVVDLPVGVSVFPNDLPAAGSWAPLVYSKVYWRELDRGGHFAQVEVNCLRRSCAAAFGHFAAHEIQRNQCKEFCDARQSTRHRANLFRGEEETQRSIQNSFLHKQIRTGWSSEGLRLRFPDH